MAGQTGHAQSLPIRMAHFWSLARDFAFRAVGFRFKSMACFEIRRCGVSASHPAFGRPLTGGVAMGQEVGADEYEWEAGAERPAGSPIPIPYLIGVPRPSRDAAEPAAAPDRRGT